MSGLQRMFLNWDVIPAEFFASCFNFLFTPKLIVKNNYPCVIKARALLKPVILNFNYSHLDLR